MVSAFQASTGELICMECHLVAEEFVVAKEVEVMGMKRTVTERMLRHVPVTRFVSHALKDCKAQTADGKALTADELAKRLTRGTPILIMNGSDKVDPAYLKIVKPDTIILFTPSPAVPRPLKPLPVERQP